MNPFRKSLPACYKLNLIESPRIKVDLETFRKKICISLKTPENELSFSVDNIIKLVSNCHGAAHLDGNFVATEMESFHWSEFNPLSLTEDSEFLVRLKEIIIILIEALQPLIQIVHKNLVQHDKKYFQSKSVAHFPVVTREEFDANPEKYIIKKKKNSINDTNFFNK